MRHIVFFMAVLLAGTAIRAEEAVPAMNPSLEKRVVQLAAELRCLVCQNQSLADSNADLAIDLKKQIREMVGAGKSDSEIRNYMVARYGEFVLYKPPLRAATLILWIGPFLCLAAALGGLGYYLRRRRANVAERELTPEEHARARALLDASNGDAR